MRGLYRAQGGNCINPDEPMYLPSSLLLKNGGLLSVERSFRCYIVVQNVQCHMTALDPDPRRTFRTSSKWEYLSFRGRDTDLSMLRTQRSAEYLPGL